jgi:uncharacterized protein YifE (UPF0438 family)
VADRLTLEEVRLLKPLAAKLELLERGAFPADTDARQHFLSVCRGEAEPETDTEIAYLKWRVTKSELALLEQDLITLAAKAQRVAEDAREARQARAEIALLEKEQKRAEGLLRLEAARRDRRRRKQLTR